MREERVRETDKRPKAGWRGRNGTREDHARTRWRVEMSHAVLGTCFGSWLPVRQKEASVRPSSSKSFASHHIHHQALPPLSLFSVRSHKFKGRAWKSDFPSNHTPRIHARAYIISLNILSAIGWKPHPSTILPNGSSFLSQRQSPIGCFSAVSSTKTSSLHR